MKTDSSPGVSALAKVVALDLGHLVGQHVNVARIELEAEMNGMVRRAGFVAVLATLLALGYGLAMAGLAVLVGGRTAVGLPLIVIGLAHVAVAGVGLLLSPRRARKERLMGVSTAALSSSLAALDNEPGSTVSPHSESSRAQ